ncbi:MAG: helix-turn-helix domain-containing protein [Christensenellales bacterium]
MIRRWVQKYDEAGEHGLRPKRRGNPYAALTTGKSLTEIERLRLLVAKQEIEIEWLKRLLGERSWCRQGVRCRLRQEYEVAQALKVEYDGLKPQRILQMAQAQRQSQPI